MNNEKREEVAARVERINATPYVLFLNDKGQGFTLDRSYKLLHENIGGYKGIRRDSIKQLKSLALKSEENYPLTDGEALPLWARRGKYVDGKPAYEIRSSFTAYWLDREDPKVQEAFHNPKQIVLSSNRGTFIHYERAKHIQQEIKDRKAEQRAEITKQYRENFRIRKPFLTGGSVRIVISSDDPELQTICQHWNDFWWEGDKFTDRSLKDAIDHFQKWVAGEEDCPKEGSVQFHLEGTYSACTTFEEAQNGEYEPWGDYWEVNHLATQVL